MSDIANRLDNLSIPEPNTGCHIWLGAVDRRGYGKITIGGRTVAAHRVAYEAANGPIPAGLNLCHRCDLPACINPDHLRPGTQLENIKDMHRKGRAALGERTNTAKLTAGKVRGIRFLASLGRPQNVMARQYDVSKMTISRIVRRELWKHIP